jgi:hypothetical protein
VVRGRAARGFPPKKQRLVCAVCDEEFMQARLNNILYCSPGCKRLAASRKIQGIPIKGPKKHVKGSGYITAQGYKILSRKHPNSSVRGQILEHKLIMSEHIGRPLKEHETVHREYSLS